MVGFFHFYNEVFHPDEHVITTSNQESSLINKELYIKQVSQKFKDNDFIQTKYISTIKSISFVIEDPFDKTYTPGRAVKRESHLEDSYFLEFERSLESLTKQGCLVENIKTKKQKKLQKAEKKV